MQNFYNIDKLNFLTAGMPLVTGKGGYPKALDVLTEMNLDGLEVEFVHGVRMSDETRSFLKTAAKEKKLILTAHGPFYINLNSKEQEKVDASVQRIIDTATAASEFGGYSITYHAAFYLGGDKETVYQQVKTQTQKIVETLEKNNIKMYAPKLDSSYKSFSGTSLSAAFISGVCALLYEKNPDLTFDDIISTLKLNADVMNIETYKQGCGKINLSKLLN